MPYPTKKLWEICEILDRQRKPISSKERKKRNFWKNNNNLFPYYWATRQKWLIDDYLFDEELVLLWEDWVEFYNKNKHKAYLISWKTWVNNHAHVIKWKKWILLNKILLNFLNIFNYHWYVSWATRLKLNQSSMKNIPIPLPPLPTQKLIVQKLDSAFKNIDESIKITKNNIENVEELNKSVLNSVFKDKNNLWIINDTLEFLTDYHANGSYKTLKENVELKDNKDYALMVRATDLEKNNFIDWVKYLSKYSYNYLIKTKVYWDEIILPKIGSIWNVYYMPKLNRPVSLWMNIFMLKINKENFSKYVYYYLSSHIWKKLILDNAQWATTKTITKISVKNIKIPLPPLEKQKEIVAYLDEVFEKNKVIKEWYEKKLKELEEIKQSILKEAFENEKFIK